MKRLRASRSARWIGLAVLALALGSAAAVTATISSQSFLRVHFKVEDTRSVGGANTTASLVRDYALAMSQGTGANQVTDCVISTRSVTTGNDDMQLDALTGPFGTVALAVVKVLVVDMTGATANVTVSSPATTGARIFDADADAITLKPGGLFVWTDPSAGGTAIVNGDTDVVRFVAASGTQSVVVAVCGEV
jgi:hypothetical protein